MEIRFFAPGGLVSNLDFVEASSAMAATLFWRQTMSGWTRLTGPGTPAV